MLFCYFLDTPPGLGGGARERNHDMNKTSEREELIQRIIDDPVFRWRTDRPYKWWRKGDRTSFKRWIKTETILHLLEKGLTQAEVARVLGVTRQAINFRLNHNKMRCVVCWKEVNPEDAAGWLGEKPVCLPCATARDNGA